MKLSQYIQRLLARRRHPHSDKALNAENAGLIEKCMPRRLWMKYHQSCDRGWTPCVGYPSVEVSLGDRQATCTLEVEAFALQNGPSPPWGIELGHEHMCTIPGRFDPFSGDYQLKSLSVCHAQYAVATCSLDQKRRRSGKRSNLFGAELDMLVWMDRPSQCRRRQQ